MDSQADIKIYGADTCCYCTAARMLLDRKGLKYEHVSIVDNAAAWDEMVERSGSKSVPQVFINGDPVGGFDELYTLERSGELDRLIRQE